MRSKKSNFVKIMGVILIFAGIAFLAIKLYVNRYVIFDLEKPYPITSRYIADTLFREWLDDTDSWSEFYMRDFKVWLGVGPIVVGTIMTLSRKKESPLRVNYDPAEQKPVIRCSICTGEQTACLKNLQSGKLTEIMVIHDSADLEAFQTACGVSEIERVY